MCQVFILHSASQILPEMDNPNHEIHSCFRKPGAHRAVTQFTSVKETRQLFHKKSRRSLLFAIIICIMGTPRGPNLE